MNASHSPHRRHVDPRELELRKKVELLNSRVRVGNSSPHKVSRLYSTTQQQFNRHINSLISSEGSESRRKE